MKKKRMRKSRLWMIISAALLVLSVAGAIVITQMRTTACTYTASNGNINDVVSMKSGEWLYTTTQGDLVYMNEEGEESFKVNVAELFEAKYGAKMGTINKLYYASDSENLWFFTTYSRDSEYHRYLFQAKRTGDSVEILGQTEFDGDLTNIRAIEEDGFLYIVTSGKSASELFKYNVEKLEAGVDSRTILYDVNLSGEGFKCTAIKMPDGINMLEADDNYLYIIYNTGVIRVAKEFADIAYHGEGGKASFEREEMDTSKYIFFVIRGVNSSGAAFVRETGKFYVTARDSKLYTFDAAKIDSLSIGSSLKPGVVDGVKLSPLPKSSSALFYETRTGVGYLLHDNSDQVTKLNLKDEEQEFTFQATFNITNLVQRQSSDDILYLYQNRYETGQSEQRVIASLDAHAKASETILNICFYVAITILLIALALFVFLLIVVLRKKELATKRALKQMRKQKWIYIALIPSLILLILFCYYEAIASIVLSFYDYSIESPTRMWNNFENYKNVFFSSAAGEAFGNMIFFLVLDLIVAIIPPIIFAFFLSVMKWEKLSNTVRTLLFISHVVPAIAGMMIWRFGIYGGNGVLNTIIGMFNGEAIDFLGNSDYARWAILMIGFPFVGAYLIFYGGMMNISKSYYEAAELEGIGIWRRFFGIDLPLVMPQLKYVFVTSFIASLQNFQRIYTITAGQSKTRTPIYLMYNNMTTGDYGQASAYATVIFVLLFGASYLNLRKQKQDMEV